MPEDKREFVYRIDAKTHITFANADWYDFARENGVAVLTPVTLIGKLLRDFICGAETKDLYDILLRKVRETGQPVTFPYRCDSPDRRRFMEMRITQLPDQAVEFRSRILREELRAPVRLMEDDVERTQGWLVMCGWCKKVALPDDRWVEVEEAIQVLQLFDAPRLPKISHGICTECSAAFTQRFDQLT